MTSMTTTVASAPASDDPVHARGSDARVLLSSVFGPYAQDDQYGSRAINPMELYHNQVTRLQGAFSVRMFHRSWGLMMIQANIEAPCTLLDFPTLARFVEEITTNRYDIVGIGAIQPNLLKVRKMCELVREHLPEATVVVGGHVANIPDLEERIDADYIVRGEGVRWMRSFLAEDVDRPIRHPHIVSGIGGRAMGVPLSSKSSETAATLIPSVGCPMGCNFCATSAMFGGKGKCVHFFQTGDELFEVMCELETAMQVRAFFVMDENFLLYRERLLRLLELMEEHHKSWALYVFSSANALNKYSMDQLVALGISWVWMGLEGDAARYSKLKGTDTRQLVRKLQAHGIRVLGSTIIGLEEHTPDNIDQAIEYAAAHDTDFHQFMLYTPVAGTPLYEEHLEKGTLLSTSEVPEADTHGQFMFRHKHPHLEQGQETRALVKAFTRDFKLNGPSVVRIARTMLQGWQRYKNHADLRIRERFRWEGRDLRLGWTSVLWAARRWFRKDPVLKQKISMLLKDYRREFGLSARLAAPLIGRYLWFRLRRETRKLQRGWTYEPPTFHETMNLQPSPVTSRSGSRSTIGS
jgi:radical SAM superfamily enzyme YgiQ (UPF0313 family)